MVLLFIMGIVPTLIAEIIIVNSYEKEAVSARTAIVRNQCNILADQLERRNYMENTEDDVINGEFDMLTGIYGGRILVINRDGKVIKDTYNLDLGKYSLSKEVIEALSGVETSLYDDESQYIEMAVSIRDGNENGGNTKGVLLLNVSTAEISNTKKMLQERGTRVLGIVVALTLVLGFLLSKILVRPFQKVTTAIEGITDGYRDEDISVTDYTETELITDAFNRMLSRVRSVDESREEFVSNVSHELKTPLASMKVLADSINMNPNAPLEQYKEFMQDISDEIDRENQIISDLLTMVRMDKKAADMNIEQININEELEQILRRLDPIAEKANVELILDTFRSVTAEVDETKLSLALTNIIENAIKYNKPEGGWVRISLNSDRKYFYITIADSGIGIPEGDFNNIFERFYRVDKSHSREIGGTGLGLAITKSAIAMHRGAIRVSSKLNAGTTFAIRIPLVHVL
ncbi:MAG: ATP-binding protein [Eubacterium sp.]|nr:ATP-binding protein [Eubacterium sp.]